MPSLAPLRRTYSTISSSSRASSNNTHCTKLREIVFKPSDLGPRTIPRYSFIIRLIIFVLLEFGFITFVSTALCKPIILHVSFTNTEVKGGVTALAIVWHALAVYVVKDILLHVFSAEWLEQYDDSKSFSLWELDIMSRLTTGLIDQAKHCMTGRATIPFLLSFLSFLLLILLNGLGPSAIGADLIFHHHPSTIRIANLTLGTNITLGDHDILSRADAIVQLEVVQNVATVGFTSTQPNILIPWPLSNSLPENVTMKYDSDVIQHNFTYSWTTLLSVDESDTKSIDVDGYKMMLIRITRIPLAGFSLVPFNPHLPKTFILFIGLAPSQLQTVEGSDVPFLSLPCNTSAYVSLFSKGWASACIPVFFSVLVCESQFEILPASINATISSLEATILSGSPTVKNVPNAATNYLFNTALQKAVTPAARGNDPRFSDFLVGQFFPTGASLVQDNGTLNLLPLDTINRKMTKALSSAAKAYLSGYVPGDSLDPPSQPSFSMVDTNAVTEMQRMALVGSKPFFVASTATVGLLVVLLGTIVAITRPDQLESFDLENIVRKLK